jgi:hypothetical protein
MLANQRDRVATRRARFAHPESYISFAGHTYLAGKMDHERMRYKLFLRAGGHCEACNVLVGWKVGEWHHAQDTRGGRRCDGLECSMWLCHQCHLRKPKIALR